MAAAVATMHTCTQCVTRTSASVQTVGASGHDADVADALGLAMPKYATVRGALS